MTTEQVIAFATPIAVIAAAIIQQMNAAKAKRDRDAVKEEVVQVAEKVAIDSHSHTTKLDAIVEKANHITELTNGHLSKVTDELKLANDKIAGLEKMITEMANRRTGVKKEKERH